MRMEAHLSDKERNVTTERKGFRVEINEDEMRILHLFYDLMNLYGDWANAAVLARELESRGHEAVIDKKSAGDEIDFGACDFVYIGSGTERSLLACLRYMERYKDALLGRIEDGMHVLATGNSHELFGRAIVSTAGERYEAFGLLDFETVQGNSRVTGDCVSKASFLPEKLIGFINRAGGGQTGDVERPFLNELGPGAGGNSAAEGIQYKNLLGTYMTGPILVRNPPLLKYFAGLLAGTDQPARPGGEEFSNFSKYQEEAYRLALKELSSRIT